MQPTQPEKQKLSNTVVNWLIVGFAGLGAVLFPSPSGTAVFLCQIGGDCNSINMVNFLHLSGFVLIGMVDAIKKYEQLLTSGSE